MAKRIVISNGKKYIVTVPDWDGGMDIGISSAGGGSTIGSFQFGGTNQWLIISGSNDFVFSTGSFTIEWFQYQTVANNFPRIYTQGVWSTAENAVSIEGASGDGTGYLWLDGLGNIPATSNPFVVATPRLDQWDHFAVARESGSYIRIFRNGTILRTITGSNVYMTADISSSKPLIIGSEGDGVAATRFNGSITSFRVVKGYALYSSSFTRPVSALTAVPGTVLLLNGIGGSFADTSGTGKTVFTGSVTSSLNGPF